MRVVTYNFLCEGSPTRDAWKAVNRLKPDVLRGQECRMRTGFETEPLVAPLHCGCDNVLQDRPARALAGRCARS